MGPGGGNSKRRTHADNIPDSEKPFSCEREYFTFFILLNLSILQGFIPAYFYNSLYKPCIYKMTKFKMVGRKEGGIPCPHSAFGLFDYFDVKKCM